MRVAIDVLRGKRRYTPGLIEAIAKIGSCPSAGGSRASIARIISHMGGTNCVQGADWPFTFLGNRNVNLYFLSFGRSRSFT